MGGADLTDALFVGAAVVVVFAYFYRKRKTEQRLKAQSSLLIRRPAQTPGAAAAGKAAGSRNFVKKMEEKKKDMVIFYGSQTGTAEDYANRLGREAKQYGFDPLILDFEDCDFGDIKQMPEGKLVFIVAATYGEGEPTDNAQEAHRLFSEEEHDADCLKSVNYVVFGLGNKTYEHYNVMGYFWDSTFEKYGATRVFDLGLGDDDGNLEEDFVTWQEGLWPAVCKFFGKDMSGAGAATTRQFRLTELGADEVDSSKVFRGEMLNVIVPPATQSKPPYDIKNPYYAELIENRELMGPNTQRSCMHVEVNLKDTPLGYLTGDHLGVFPSNRAEEVERLCKALRIADPDRIFTFVAVDPSASKQSPFPTPCSYRTALTHYLDITSPPRTHIIKALADSAGNDADKVFFQRLISPEGKDELAKYVVSDCRTLAEILEEHPATVPPVDLVLELLPRLQCRYYSISSSPKAHPTAVHICATTVKYTTPTGREAHGVATSWLNTMRNPQPTPPHRVPVFIRKSNFKLPGLASRPIIMIGPGTGVAPFRGFIQEREWQRQQGKQVGPTILFFGCRNQDEFIYANEMRQYEETGLLELHVAYSRLPGIDKKYVQHLLVENKARMWELITQGAYLYVCGDAKNMARDVQKTVIDMVQELGGKSEAEAIAYVKAMRSSNRYLEDVWS